MSTRTASLEILPAVTMTQEPLVYITDRSFGDKNRETVCVANAADARSIVDALNAAFPPAAAQTGEQQLLTNVRAWFDEWALNEERVQLDGAVYLSTFKPLLDAMVQDHDARVEAEKAAQVPRTDAELRKALTALGFKVEREDNEYRVAPKGLRPDREEAVAFYTHDRADALDTARLMVRQGMSAWTRAARGAR